MRVCPPEQTVSILYFHAPRGRELDGGLLPNRCSICALHFRKRSQLFIRSRNETLSFTVRVNDPNCACIIVKAETPAPTQTGFAEIVSDRENAVGLVRLDYGAEVVQHADLCPVRARERAVLRVRDGVADRVWPCIPDRAVSKPTAD